MERSLHQQRVDDFMRLASQEVPQVPMVPSDATRILRAKLIFEEAMETINKGLGVSVAATSLIGHRGMVEPGNLDFKIAAPFDMVETVDGCCDIEVVTTGTLTACGVSDEGPQRLVDESNLAKFSEGGYRAAANDPNGHAEGKWIKPADWTPPDIAGVLAKQGWTEPE